MGAKTWLRRAALAASPLALAACGGGGGDIASTGTPPPPPATYTKIADMTGNRIFQTSGITYNTSTNGFTNGTNQAFGSGMTVAYNSATDSYTLTAPDGASQTFGPADRQVEVCLSACRQVRIGSIVPWRRSSGNVTNR